MVAINECPISHKGKFLKNCQRLQIRSKREVQQHIGWFLPIDVLGFTCTADGTLPRATRTGPLGHGKDRRRHDLKVLDWKYAQWFEVIRSDSHRCGTVDNHGYRAASRVACTLIAVDLQPGTIAAPDGYFRIRELIIPQDAQHS